MLSNLRPAHKAALAKFRLHPRPRSGGGGDGASAGATVEALEGLMPERPGPTSPSRSARAVKEGVGVQSYSGGISAASASASAGAGAGAGAGGGGGGGVVRSGAEMESQPEFSSGSRQNVHTAAQKLAVGGREGTVSLQEVLTGLALLPGECIPLPLPLLREQMPLQGTCPAFRADCLRAAAAASAAPSTTGAAHVDYPRVMTGPVLRSGDVVTHVNQHPVSDAESLALQLVACN